jgi:hypothetical protein
VHIQQPPVHLQQNKHALIINIGGTPQLINSTITTATIRSNNTSDPNIINKTE